METYGKFFEEFIIMSEESQEEMESRSDWRRDMSEGRIWDGKERCRQHRCEMRGIEKGMTVTLLK